MNRQFRPLVLVWWCPENQHSTGIANNEPAHSCRAINSPSNVTGAVHRLLGIDYPSSRPPGRCCARCATGRRGCGITHKSVLGWYLTGFFTVAADVGRKLKGGRRSSEIVKTLGEQHLSYRSVFNRFVSVCGDGPALGLSIQSQELPSAILVRCAAR